MVNRLNLKNKTTCFIILFLTFLFPGSYNIFATGAMRNLTAKELVWDMKVGWNLGNTMDAPTETNWGNPVTTQAMIDTVKAMGFKTVRIPVSWTDHFGSSPSYTIDATWLSRVDEIVNYVLKDGMYAILNSHHDAASFPITASDSAVCAKKLAVIWTQIANHFKSYSDYLIFETLNEPRGTVDEWIGGNDLQRKIINSYHLAAVNAIRATGGNNATRFIMCCTHSACPLDVAINGLVIPNNDSKVIVSIHTYYPQGFSMSASPSTWGSTADYDSVTSELKRELAAVTKKNTSAVIGEWGSISSNNLSSRVAHAENYAKQARSYGMVPIWWDNGASDFGILNRNTTPPSWTYPTIAKALVSGANSAVVPIVNMTLENKITDNCLKERAGTINYTLQKTSSVSLRLFNTQGKIVATIVNKNQSAGNYAVKLPTDGISLGNYILEFKAENNLITKKIILL